MLGLAGLIMVVWLLGKLCLRPPTDRWQHRYGFWFWLFAVVTFVGIALVGSVELFGIAHICLQPLVLIGLTYAAVGLPDVPLPVRAIALFGLLIDAVLGTLLHIHLLRNAFEISIEGDNLKISSHTDMGRLALMNGITKYQKQVVFCGDYLGSVAANVIELIGILGALAICIGLWWLAMHSRPSFPARHPSIPTAVV
jgi:hypothetical protein